MSEILFGLGLNDFLAVFAFTMAFNRDLAMWDVSAVTTTFQSEWGHTSRVLMGARFRSHSGACDTNAIYFC